MSNTQRDIVVTLQGLNSQYVPLSDSEFIYLKESGGKLVKVVIDDATIEMAEGDERRFAPDEDGKFVSKMDVINENSTPVRIVFTVGQGSFRRTRIFAGTSGSLDVRSTLRNAAGDAFDNSLQETEIRLGVDQRGVSELGSSLDWSLDQWGQTNLIGSPGPNLYEIHTWDQYRRGDRNLQIPQPNNTVPFNTGDPAVLATFRGAFIHPFTGWPWVATGSNGDGEIRFHEMNLKRNLISWTTGLNPASGETYLSPSIDWYTGNLFLPYAAGFVREFRWVIVDTLGGPRYTLEAVQDLEFDQSTGAIYTVHRLGDGRYLVSGLSGTQCYDTDANDNNFISDYQDLDNVSGDQTGGLVNPANQLYIDERENRSYVGGIALAKRGYLFDLEADLLLTAHTNNLSQNFEHWKKPMPISGVHFHKDGGYRFLQGTVVAAVVKLIRGSNNIPADYLDYVYKIRFHNGVNWTTIDTARDSFSSANIADGIKVNADEPIFITARAGLLDPPASLFISDNNA